MTWPQAILASHADNTNRSYKYLFTKWKSWAESRNLSVLQADPFHVAFFATSLLSESSAGSCLKGLVPAIAWGHRLVGLSFDKTEFLKDLLSCFKRQVARPRVPKDIISLEHIKSIINMIDFSSLTDVRTSTMIVLSFFGFLRFNELASLKRSDLEFHTGYVKIHIRRSKTDQLTQGDHVVISESQDKFCPCNLLRIYLILVQIGDLDECFIFRNIASRDSFDELRQKDIPLLYSRVRELILQKFGQLGLHTADFGIHSLRAGEFVCERQPGQSVICFTGYVGKRACWHCLKLSLG